MLTIVCRTNLDIDKGILIKFGKKVREERTNRGFSQENFAEKVGVYRTHI